MSRMDRKKTHTHNTQSTILTLRNPAVITWFMVHPHKLVAGERAQGSIHASRSHPVHYNAHGTALTQTAPTGLSQGPDSVQRFSRHATGSRVPTRDSKSPSVTMDMMSRTELLSLIRNTRIKPPLRVPRSSSAFSSASDPRPSSYLTSFSFA